MDLESLRQRRTPKADSNLKLIENAKVLSKACGIDYRTAYAITQKLWAEALRNIKTLSGDNWKKLSFEDKAAICGLIVKSLLNKKKLMGFMAGGRKTLI